MRHYCLLILISALAAGCSRSSEQTVQTSGPPVTTNAPPSIDNETDEPLITVNGRPITRQRLDWEVHRRIGAAKLQMSPQQFATIQSAARTNVAQKLIEFLLLLDAAETQNIPASVDDLKHEYERQKSTAGFPRNMTFTSATNHPAHRQNIVAHVKINRYLAGAVTNVQEVSQADIAAFRKENADTISKLPELAWARHILIGFDKDDTDDQKRQKHKQANVVRERILQGEDFAELAAQHSTCPTRAIGGYLAAFPRGRMVPAFDAAAFSQPIGQVGTVVETAHGYHVIEVMKRVAAGAMDDEEVIAKIRQDRNTDSVKGIVEGLRENADIVTNGSL